MSICRATKRSGDPCTLPATDSNGFCWAHNPANAEKRRRMASRAGKGKPNSEIRALKARLHALADMVEEGRMDRADAAVIGQIWGTYIRAVGMDIRVKEFEEVAREVEELREMVQANKGRGGYGT
jgi:Family of unknown function (DUF5763)